MHIFFHLVFYVLLCCATEILYWALSKKEVGCRVALLGNGKYSETEMSSQVKDFEWPQSGKIGRMENHELAIGLSKLLAKNERLVFRYLV